jgi:hypothetical protein
VSSYNTNRDYTHYIRLSQYNKTYMIGTCRYTTINDAKFQIQLLFHRHFIENILNRDTSNEPLNDVLKSLKSKA